MLMLCENAFDKDGKLILVVFLEQRGAIPKMQKVSRELTELAEEDANEDFCLPKAYQAYTLL